MTSRDLRNIFRSVMAWAQMLRRGAVGIIGVTIACSLFLILPAMVAQSNNTSASAAVTGFSRDVDPTTIQLDRPVRLRFMVPDFSRYKWPQEQKLPFGAVSGYRVTAARVNTDPINTPEGYRRAAELDVAQALAKGTSDPVTATTNRDGVAVFSALKPGAYLITTEPPADPSRFYAKPQDMVVILPLVSEHGQWNYDPLVVAKFEPPQCDCPPGGGTTSPKPPPTNEIPPKPDKPAQPPQPTPTTSTTPPDSSAPPPNNQLPPPSSPGGGKGSTLPVTGVEAFGLIGGAILLFGLGLALVVVAKLRQQRESS